MACLESLPTRILPKPENLEGSQDIWGVKWVPRWANHLFLTLLILLVLRRYVDEPWRFAFVGIQLQNILLGYFLLFRYSGGDLKIDVLEDIRKRLYAFLLCFASRLG